MRGICVSLSICDVADVAPGVIGGDGDNGVSEEEGSEESKRASTRASISTSLSFSVVAIVKSSEALVRLLVCTRSVLK